MRILLPRRAGLLCLLAGAAAYFSPAGGAGAALFAALAAGAAFAATVIARRRAEKDAREKTAALGAAERTARDGKRRAEESGARFSAVIEELGEGVVCVSPEGTVIAANKRAREMLSVTGDITGRNYWEAVFSSQIRGLIEEALGKEGKEPPDGEPPDGDSDHKVIRREVADIYPSRNFYEATAARLRSGEVVLVLADTATLKALADKNRALVTNMSHEIRTPLTAIVGAAEAIAEMTGGADGETKKMAGLLERNARRLAGLCDRVVRLTQADERGTGEKERFFLADAVSAAVETVSGAAAKKNIRIETEAGGGVTVEGDRVMIESALVNLIDNAVKYSPQGGTVTVRAADGEGFAKATVSDRGAGITAEERERIFDRFHRGSAAAGTEGSGLGLSIARQTAGLHGGNITVESEPGRGSVFTISFRTADG